MHTCMCLYVYIYIYKHPSIINFVLKYNFLPKPYGNETEKALFIYINEKCTHRQKCKC